MEEFLTNPPDWALCGVCKTIMRHPYYNGNCECDITVCKKDRSELCTGCNSSCHWRLDRKVKGDIEKLSLPCLCGESVSVKEAKKHMEVCPVGLFNCKPCKFRGNRDQMLKHLYDNHYFSILIEFDKIMAERMTKQS